MHNSVFCANLFQVFSMRKFRSLSGTILTAYRAEANRFGREYDVSRVMHNKYLSTIFDPFANQSLN